MAIIRKLRLYPKKKLEGGAVEFAALFLDKEGNLIPLDSAGSGEGGGGTGPAGLPEGLTYERDSTQLDSTYYVTDEVGAVSRSFTVSSESGLYVMSDLLDTQGVPTAQKHVRATPDEGFHAETFEQIGEEYYKSIVDFSYEYGAFGSKDYNGVREAWSIGYLGLERISDTTTVTIVWPAESGTMVTDATFFDMPSNLEFPEGLGPVLKSPNGTRYLLQVADDGSLSTVLAPASY